MKALYKNPLIIILIVVSVFCFIYFKEYLPSVHLKNIELSNIISILGYLSVVMLVVEQVIEIFVFDPNEKTKVKNRKRLEEINKFLESLNDPENSMIVDIQSLPEETRAEKVIRLMKEKREIEDFLLTRGQIRQQRTITIAFVIGLVLSLSGLRLMSGIILPESAAELSEIQIKVIVSIDIILTAGIIAGGSDRMHRLIRRAKEIIGNDTF
ncbi:hypothetical protein J8281_14375 [Aquimarina sp. U1-2]|uniref:hypothetical protein n=1 Tax=Aquimarina sp. U1-2 TaxID=2823141 RepID=UPI001AECB698|nr:hypothetical protein [Aquimarina sp. U1-2]MBP2833378.1 hypothetical protein [Aquimarina sp. U1-2]